MFQYKKAGNQLQVYVRQHRRKSDTSGDMPTCWGYEQITANKLKPRHPKFTMMMRNQWPLTMKRAAKARCPNRTVLAQLRWSRRSEALEAGRIRFSHSTLKKSSQIYSCPRAEFTQFRKRRKILMGLNVNRAIMNFTPCQSRPC